MFFPRAVISGWRACLWLVFLTVWQPRQARAEDAVTYKFQDYVEDGGRVVSEVVVGGRS